MNVLVIGDEHTYGYGLSGGKLSYLGHFIRLISRTGQQVSVEAYAHLTMPQLATTLTQLPLNRYDLIILQFDHSLLQSVKKYSSGASAITTPMLPYTSFQSAQSDERGLRHHANAFGTALLSVFWPSFASTHIGKLLNQLRPYRHNVLLVTPLPHRAWLGGWLRKRSRTLLLKEAEKQLFSVFDSDSVIRPREEYFLPNDKEHLSAVSHELLGRLLFDFYQSAPTIVTIQSTRRE